MAKPPFQSYAAFKLTYVPGNYSSRIYKSVEPIPEAVVLPVVQPLPLFTIADAVFTPRVVDNRDHNSDFNKDFN